jgi:hypothetical protein
LEVVVAQKLQGQILNLLLFWQQKVEKVLALALLDLVQMVVLEVVVLIGVVVTLLDERAGLEIHLSVAPHREIMGPTAQILVEMVWDMAVVGVVQVALAQLAQAEAQPLVAMEAMEQQTLLQDRL